MSSNVDNWCKTFKQSDWCVDSISKTTSLIQISNIYVFCFKCNKNSLFALMIFAFYYLFFFLSIVTGILEVFCLLSFTSKRLLHEYI